MHNILSFFFIFQIINTIIDTIELFTVITDKNNNNDSANNNNLIKQNNIKNTKIKGYYSE